MFLNRSFFVGFVCKSDVDDESTTSNLLVNPPEFHAFAFRCVGLMNSFYVANDFKINGKTEMQLIYPVLSNGISKIIKDWV